jgi:pyruvate kinase
MLLKQTKIVASISDRRCDVDFIKQLFDAGMNVVRMNTAHASREGFEALIANVRAVSNRIAILMDTKGPEVRTTANAEPIPYKIEKRNGNQRKKTEEGTTSTDNQKVSAVS